METPTIHSAEAYLRNADNPPSLYVRIDGKCRRSFINRDDISSASSHRENGKEVIFSPVGYDPYQTPKVKYNLSTWKEMPIQLCGHVLLEKRSTLEWLCANEKSGFSSTPESGRMEFSDGLFVGTDNSTSSKIWVIHGMFSECNIPYLELAFEFRASSGTEPEE